MLILRFDSKPSDHLASWPVGGVLARIASLERRRRERERSQQEEARKEQEVNKDWVKDVPSINPLL